MDDCYDFIQWLGADMSIKILMCLDNPTDLVRASAVSSSWRHFGEFGTLFVDEILSVLTVFSVCLMFG